MSDIDFNRATANRFYATYNDSSGTEQVILELRHIVKEGFLLYTIIRGNEYKIFEVQFNYVLEEFFSKLPIDASFSITHDLLWNENGKESRIRLTECLSSERINDNVSPTYQFELNSSKSTFSTKPISDAKAALEWLATQFNEKQYLKICAFCEFMYEDDLYGHSDGRHDRLYCFRDQKNFLSTIKSLPRKSPEFPNTLFHMALQDIDMFHSCSAFELAQDYEFRLRNTKRRVLEKGTP